MIGQVRFHIGNEHVVATLTEDGDWQCSDADTAALLRAISGNDGCLDREDRTEAVRHLYQVAHRLGGNVQVSRSETRATAICGSGA